MATTTERLAPVDLLAEVASALANPARLPLAQLIDLADRVDAALAYNRAQAEQARVAALNSALSFANAQRKRQEVDRLENEILHLAFALDWIADQMPNSISHT